VLNGIRRGARTVNALASMLGVTDNGIRLHLASLARDGLIQRSSVRRSGQVGQPAVEYDLTPVGEVALSSAYVPALTALMAAIGSKLKPKSARKVLVNAGRRLAAQVPPGRDGPLGKRAHSCAALLESLGGKIDVTTGPGIETVTLAGAGCPLAAAVRTEPGTCYMVEAMLEKHADVKAVMRCQHGDHPACRFEISPAD
jgi:predicted ArsR family transcriptional regulator